MKSKPDKQKTLLDASELVSAAKKKTGKIAEAVNSGDFSAVAKEHEDRVVSKLDSSPVLSFAQDKTSAIGCVVGNTCVPTCVQGRSRKLVDISMLVLIALGLAINIGGAQLALGLGIPLFLDCIGTVAAAVLGGALPGIIVGFLTNMINGISDPITMYYGILSVLMAVAAAHLARKRMFATFGRCMLAVLVFTFIGGVLGSCLTWLLYGFNFGTGISAPLANALHSSLSMGEFVSQLSADMLIDFGDKLITVLLIFLLLKLLPDKWLDKTLQGGYYTKDGASEVEAAIAESAGQYRKRSLKIKVLILIVGTAVIIGATAIAISYVIYSTEMTGRFIDTSMAAVELVSDVVLGDDIGTYLESGGTSTSYKAAEGAMSRIYESIPDLQYLYVYQMTPEGIRVVFDLDTTDFKGNNCGDIIAYDESFLPLKDALLAGKEIEPIITNDTYGHLLTVYKPIMDSHGVCRAYACADVSMENIVTNRMVFIIKLLSLLFGAAVFVLVFAVWYAERRMVDPINAMTRAAGVFAYDSDEERLNGVAVFESLKINTGDEIETLYKSLNKTVKDVAGYIDLVQEKADIILQMQNSIILSFADMVENRDENTGEHIKHTAQYVDVIARELQKEGAYPELTTDAEVEEMVRSAPLHDIGKIKISDSLLNKPGKLTDEEFSLMKTHTTEGRSILLGVEDNISNGESYLDTAVDMASYHHEWWNGKGYPKALHGEEIPLSARIMAVADVFDALTSRRSYKEAMPLEKAKSIILEESGTHFDPAVVDAFINAWDEIKSIKKPADAANDAQTD